MSNLSYSTPLPPATSTDNRHTTEPPDINELCFMRSPRGEVECVPLFAQVTILNLIRRGWTIVEEVG